MELHQYERIFTACALAEEFLREFPGGKRRYDPSLTVAESTEQGLQYKQKLRKYRSNMAKLLTIFVEHKEARYGTFYQKPEYDFYVLTIMWLFSRANVVTEGIENAQPWWTVRRDAEHFLNPSNGTRMTVNRFNRPMSIPNSPSEEQLALIKERLDHFESILRTPKEERLKKVVRLKLTMA